MATGQIYTGTVTDVDETTGLPLVNVPMLATRASFGPLESLAPGLAVGERVAVTNLGSSANSLIVLGRTGGRWPVIGEIPGLAAQLTALATANAAEELRLTAVEALNATQDGRLTAAEGKNTTQDGRLTSVEARASALETRATSIEGVNGTQDGRLTTVEGRASALETRATAIESKNTSQDTAITAAQTAANSGSTAVTTLRADTAGKAAAKGDLLIATGAGVLTNHAVPANGLSLVADSTAADGWAAKDQLGMPRALTGAVAATRYVGGTTAGAPTTGAFLLGDFVVDQTTGETWVCTVAGSPGTWVSSLAAVRTAVFGGPTRTRVPTCVLYMSAADRVLPATPAEIYQDAQWSVVTDPDAMWHTGAQPTNGYMQMPVAGRYDVEHLSLMGGIANAFVIARVVLNTIAPASIVASDVRVVPAGLSEPFYVRARLIDRALAANDKLYFSVWSSAASTVYAAKNAIRTGVTCRWVGPI